MFNNGCLGGNSFCPFLWCKHFHYGQFSSSQCEHPQCGLGKRAAGSHKPDQRLARSPDMPFPSWDKLFWDPLLVPLKNRRMSTFLGRGDSSEKPHGMFSLSSATLSTSYLTGTRPTPWAAQVSSPFILLHLPTWVVPLLLFYKVKVESWRGEEAPS